VLTLQERAEIEQLLGEGRLTQSAIAARFGVSRKRINEIANPKDRAAAQKTTGGIPISVRATPEEVAAVDDVVARHGYASRSHLIRHLIKVAGEITDPDPASAQVLAEMARQLRGVAVNINQMARAANRGKLAWSDQDRVEMSRLAEGCGQLSREIAGMVEQAVRRAKASRIHDRDALDVEISSGGLRTEGVSSGEAQGSENRHG
jgi:type IV secretion system T-DNA border endonuclease VirD1